MGNPAPHVASTEQGLCKRACLPGFLARLSGKSKQTLFCGLTSGHIWISKLYLALLYRQKPRSTSPSAIFQTVSRRPILGNRASGIRASRRSFDAAAHTRARFAYTSFVSKGRNGAQRKCTNGTTSF